MIYSCSSQHETHSQVEVRWLTYVLNVLQCFLSSEMSWAGSSAGIFSQADVSWKMQRAMCFRSNVEWWLWRNCIPNTWGSLIGDIHSIPNRPMSCWPMWALYSIETSKERSKRAETNFTCVRKSFYIDHRICFLYLTELEECDRTNWSWLKLLPSVLVSACFLLLSRQSWPSESAATPNKRNQHTRDTRVG